MFNWLRKRRALNRFVEKLPLDLVRRYGRRETFAPAQLERTLTEGRYPRRFRGYAAVLLLGYEDAVSQLGEERLYHCIREELAHRFFHGDTNFSVVTHSLKLKRIERIEGIADAATFPIATEGGGDG